ncbi:uncharacterized protein LY89DRAFT_351259 [Mollisia scopiformis]|uniref:Uncharacterized protein n=1 Tax=Mollisia scopiformis TaxID=149040 RepID=A0A132B5J1_MOLSC|nr:uncharacterized protein LY89DRAFT_351259 [Mollisia scopiformis]KUJ07678.1 hypothetical protein LY89DRAFT_351259 [Mollisia scopiformis]
MELKPSYEPKATKPMSQAIKGFRDGFWQTHPLLTTQGHTRIRANFTIADWLLMGSLLQAFIILSTPLPLAYVLMPTFGLVAFKLTRTVLKIYSIVENPRMENVIPGRQTALFPPKDGSMIRQPGEPVGGDGMCIVLLTNKSNHPLGLFFPTFRTLSLLARAMYRDLEAHAEEYGFLGFSDYNSNDVLKQPVVLSVMYFKSVEHVQKWAHGKVHREGWDWWNEMSALGKTDQITIGHEIYSVPAGNWENVYMNSKPHDFGATQHAIKTAGGERRWLCPLMDSKDLKNASQRLGSVRG